MSTNAVR